MPTFIWNGISDLFNTMVGKWIGSLVLPSQTEQEKDLFLREVRNITEISEPEKQQAIEANTPILIRLKKTTHDEYKLYGSPYAISDNWEWTDIDPQFSPFLQDLPFHVGKITNQDEKFSDELINALECGHARIHKKARVFSKQEIERALADVNRKKIIEYDFYWVDKNPGVKLNTLSLKSTENMLNQDQYIIRFPGNNEIYAFFLKEIKEDAEMLGCNVIAFDYRNVGLSKGRAVNSLQELIDDGIAQVQTLLDKGVPAENITLKGRSLGAVIAIHTAEYFHRQGKKMYLYGITPFSTLTQVLIGWIRAKSNFSYNNNQIRFNHSGHQETAIGIFLGWMIKPIIAFVLNLAKWDKSTGKAFRQLPVSHKEYTLIRSSKLDREIHPEGCVDDGIVTHFASLHMAEELQQERKIKKQNLKRIKKVYESLLFSQSVSSQMWKLTESIKQAVKTTKIIIKMVVSEIKAVRKNLNSTKLALSEIERKLSDAEEKAIAAHNQESESFSGGKMNKIMQNPNTSRKKSDQLIKEFKNLQKEKKIINNKLKGELETLNQKMILLNQKIEESDNSIQDEKNKIVEERKKYVNQLTVQLELLREHRGIYQNTNEETRKRLIYLISHKLKIASKLDGVDKEEENIQKLKFYNQQRKMISINPERDGHNLSETKLFNSNKLTAQLHFHQFFNKNLNIKDNVQAQPREIIELQERGLRY